MFSIEKSSQFQQEYKLFKDKIEKIDNESLKKELESILQSLRSQVKLLDTQHNEFGFDNRLPPIVVDTRNNISNTRKILSTKLKDYDKSRNS